MGRRFTGVMFCLIATLLISAKYISAAIFGSNVSSWDSGLFNAMLKYVGGTLSVFSLIALIIGIAYLVMAEIKKEWYFINNLNLSRINLWEISNCIYINLFVNFI